jgi:hypothetical protein
LLRRILACNAGDKWRNMKPLVATSWLAQLLELVL